MSDWEEVRDWEVTEAVRDLPENSYDLVGRDFPVNEVEVPFLQYRRQNYMVEAGFFYSGDREDVMDDIDVVREALRSSSFMPRIFLEDVDAARPEYRADVEGNYLISGDIEAEEIKVDLEELMPSDLDFSGLENIVVRDKKPWI